MKKVEKREITKIISIALCIVCLFTFGAPKKKIKKTKDIRTLKKYTKEHISIILLKRKLDKSFSSSSKSSSRQPVPVVKPCDTPIVWWVRNDQLKNALDKFFKGEKLGESDIEKVLLPVDFNRGTSKEGDWEQDDVLYIPIICWQGEKAQDITDMEGETVKGIETVIKSRTGEDEQIPFKFSFIEDGEVREDDLPKDVVPLYESTTRFLRGSLLLPFPEDPSNPFWNLYFPMIKLNFYLHGAPPEDLGGFPRAPFENFYSVDYEGKVKIEITNPKFGLVPVPFVGDAIPTTPFRVEGPLRIVREATSTSSVTHPEQLKIIKTLSINITSVASSNTSILSISGTENITLAGNNPGTATISIRYTKPNQPKNIPFYEATFVKVYVFLSPVDELLSQLDNATWFDVYLLSLIEPPIGASINIKSSESQQASSSCNKKAAKNWNDFLQGNTVRYIPATHIIIKVEKGGGTKGVYHWRELEKISAGAVDLAHSYCPQKDGQPDKNSPWCFSDFDPGSLPGEKDGEVVSHKRKPRIDVVLLQQLLKWQSCWESSFIPLSLDKNGRDAVGLLQIEDEKKDGFQIPTYYNHTDEKEEKYDFADIRSVQVFKDMSLVKVCKKFNEIFAPRGFAINKDIQVEVARRFLNGVKNDPRLHPFSAVVYATHIHRHNNNSALIGVKEGAIKKGFKGFDASDIILPYLPADITKLKQQAGANLDLGQTRETNACERAIQKPEQCNTAQVVSTGDFIIARQILGAAYNGFDQLISAITRGAQDKFNISSLQGRVRTYAESAGELTIRSKQGCPGY